MNRTDRTAGYDQALAPKAAIGRLVSGVADGFDRCLRAVEDSALHIDSLLSPGSAVRQEVAEIRMACGQGGRLVWQLREIAHRTASGEESVEALNQALARLVGSHASEEHAEGSSPDEVLRLTLGEHAGALAHRFNNLLTVVKGNGELMLADLPADHAARKPLMALDRAADEAGRLTLRLSGFGCRRILQPQRVDLRDLPGIVGEGSERQPALSAVEWMLPEERVEVLADRAALATLVAELVSNAQALGPDIAVRVAVGVEEVGEQLSSASERPVAAGAYAVIRVADDGGGFAPELLGGLFLPFMASPGSSGGLGLANVYGLAKQMGGGVRVESGRGAGSEVQVYLPLALEMQTPEATRARPAILPERDLTILVVDDSEGVRSILRKLLGRWGYRILEAEDGRNAAEVAAEYDGAIDLMITDVVMPYLSGPEAFRRIAQQRPGMQVIFMSGYSDNTLSTHRLASEGQAILPKPVTPVDLARKVAGLRYGDSSRANPGRS